MHSQLEGARAARHATALQQQLDEAAPPSAPSASVFSAVARAQLEPVQQGSGVHCNSNRGRLRVPGEQHQASQAVTVLSVFSLAAAAGEPVTVDADAPDESVSGTATACTSTLHSS